MFRTGSQRKVRICTRYMQAWRWETSPEEKRSGHDSDVAPSAPFLAGIGGIRSKTSAVQGSESTGFGGDSTGLTTDDTLLLQLLSTPDTTDEISPAATRKSLGQCKRSTWPTVRAHHLEWILIHSK